MSAVGAGQGDDGAHGVQHGRIVLLRPKPDRQRLNLVEIGVDLVVYQADLPPSSQAARMRRDRLWSPSSRHFAAHRSLQRRRDSHPLPAITVGVAAEFWLATTGQLTVARAALQAS